MYTVHQHCPPMYETYTRRMQSGPPINVAAGSTYVPQQVATTAPADGFSNWTEWANCLHDMSTANRTNGSVYEFMLDMQHFLPEEIAVKMSNSFVVVEAKHEERTDKLGAVKRNFVRRFKLPEECHMEDIYCCLSIDGVLLISIPTDAAYNNDERMMPVHWSAPLRPPKPEEPKPAIKPVAKAGSVAAVNNGGPGGSVSGVNGGGPGGSVSGVNGGGPSGSVSGVYNGGSSSGVSGVYNGGSSGGIGGGYNGGYNGGIGGSYSAGQAGRAADGAAMAHSGGVGGGYGGAYGAGIPGGYGVGVPGGYSGGIVGPFSGAYGGGIVGPFAGAYGGGVVGPYVSGITGGYAGSFPGGFSLGISGSIPINYWK